MAFNSTALKTTLAAPILAVAFAANAQVELTCHTTPEAIKAAQTQILQTEGMIPVTSHFRNVGTDQKASWAMATVMMNPTTKNGYEWARMPQGHVCVGKSYSHVELMSNTSFSPKAFVDLKSFPRADDTGNGTDFSTVGINAALIGSKSTGKNPMYRATVDSVIDIASAKPTKSSPNNVEFLVSNPTTKEGILLTAAPNGKVIGSFTRVAGMPQKDGVKFGAIYSPAAEDMLGISSVALAANSVAPR